MLPVTVSVNAPVPEVLNAVEREGARRSFELAGRAGDGAGGTKGARRHVERAGDADRQGSRVRRDTIQMVPAIANAGGAPPTMANVPAVVPCSNPPPTIWAVVLAPPRSCPMPLALIL